MTPTAAALSVVHLILLVACLDICQSRNHVEDAPLSLKNFDRHNRNVPSCDVPTIFHGKWHFGEHKSMEEITTFSGIINASYNRCPNTLTSLSSNPWFLEKQVSYSCDPKLVKPALFVPYNCSIVHLTEAVSALQQYVVDDAKRPLNVVFLGDSLGAQMYIAFSCLLELLESSHLMKLRYEFEALFRGDIPCVDKCTFPGETGERFRQQQSGIQL
jgi:hypothetical protein